MLKTFRMVDIKPVKTPMHIYTPLDKDENGRR